MGKKRTSVSNRHDNMFISHVYRNGRIDKYGEYKGTEPIDMLRLFTEMYILHQDEALSLAVLVTKKHIQLNDKYTNIEREIINMCNEYDHPLRGKIDDAELYIWSMILQNKCPNISVLTGSAYVNDEYIINWRDEIQSYWHPLALRCIPNHGQTCYAASTLQLLCSISFIGDYFGNDLILFRKYIKGHEGYDNIRPSDMENIVTNLGFKYGEPGDALQFLLRIIEKYKICMYIITVSNCSPFVLPDIDPECNFIVVVHEFDDNNRAKFNLPVILGTEKKYILHGASMYCKYDTDAAHYSAIFMTASNLYVYDPEMEHPRNKLQDYTPRFLIYIAEPEK